MHYVQSHLEASSQRMLGWFCVINGLSISMGNEMTWVITDIYIWTPHLSRTGQKYRTTHITQAGLLLPTEKLEMMSTVWAPPYLGFWILPFNRWHSFSLSGIVLCPSYYRHHILKYVRTSSVAKIHSPCIWETILLDSILRIFPKLYCKYNYSHVLCHATDLFLSCNTATSRGLDFASWLSSNEGMMSKMSPTSGSWCTVQIPISVNRWWLYSQFSITNSHRHWDLYTNSAGLNKWRLISPCGEGHMVQFLPGRQWYTPGRTTPGGGSGCSWRQEVTQLTPPLPRLLCNKMWTRGRHQIKII